MKHVGPDGAPRGEETYVYNPDGDLIEAANSAAVVKLERDPLGRVLREAVGQDSVESEYGPLGLRVRMRTSKGHALEIERNVVGDVVGLRAGGGPMVSPANQAKPDTTPAWEARFTRNLLGLEMERHLPGGVRGRWERDKLGRPLKHEIWAGRNLLAARSYAWEPNDRLKMIVDAMRGPVQFSHDGLGNLVSAVHADGKVDLRMPDAVGNLFKTSERRDRKYGPAGQLLESWDKTGVTRYAYDPEGNLMLKVLPDGTRWQYQWNAAGMLAKVVRPDGREVEFGYDALGRRVWKKFGAKTTRWLWDGNVPVHEWVEVDPKALAAAPAPVPSASGARPKQREADLSERTAQGPPITWVFEPESFAPSPSWPAATSTASSPTTSARPPPCWTPAAARCGPPTSTSNGQLRNLTGDKHACPFRWPGQYEDEETGLYYNRFRYYDPESGEYVSQDPLRLEGGRQLHGYVSDPQTWTDPFGLAAACGTRKVIVLGEGMGRVKAAVRDLRKAGVDAKWYQAWGKNFPAPGVNMTPAQLKASLARNERWLRSKIKQGYEIFDIGSQAGRATPSPFYQLEQQILRSTGYPATHLPGY